MSPARCFSERLTVSMFNTEVYVPSMSNTKEAVVALCVLHTCILLRRFSEKLTFSMFNMEVCQLTCLACWTPKRQCTSLTFSMFNT